MDTSVLWVQEKKGELLTQEAKIDRHTHTKKIDRHREVEGSTIWLGMGMASLWRSCAERHSSED